MAPKRIPRNTRVEVARFSYSIERRRKERFEQLASHAGVSGAFFLERLLDHLEEDLNDRGLPTWWPETDPRDGELDMAPD